MHPTDKCCLDEYGDIRRNGMMKDKLKFFDGLAREVEPLGNCCTCGKEAHVRIYGGEPGDYCSDCAFEMLKRINGMK
jgi:hypothetical protein